MIKGIGIDIIEIRRIEKAVKKNNRLLGRVFTLEENEYFKEKNYSPQTISGYFAAKEAVAKALGTGIGSIRWKDIEVLKDDLGKPYIKLHNNALKIAYNMNIETILISISHSRENAIAQAIAI